MYVHVCNDVLQLSTMYMYRLGYCSVHIWKQICKGGRGGGVGRFKFPLAPLPLAYHSAILYNQEVTVFRMSYC